MRTRTVIALAGVLLAAAISGATLGLARDSTAAPGDNGDVKVHNAGTPTDDQSNEPQVCVFYLDAFNFDGLQTLDWEIDQQPPTGTAEVASGTITLDENGHGYTSDMTPPPGHYKVVWTWGGEHGKSKSKVFTVS